MTASLVPHVREPRTTPDAAQPSASLHTFAGEPPHADGVGRMIAAEIRAVIALLAVTVALSWPARSGCALAYQSIRLTSVHTLLVPRCAP